MSNTAKLALSLSGILVASLVGLYAYHRVFNPITHFRTYKKTGVIG